MEAVDLSFEQAKWYTTPGVWGPGSTYGGIAARMQLEPISENYNTLSITETVRPFVDDCSIILAGVVQDLCTTGGGAGFVVGSAQRTLTTWLPSISNSFWDLHLLHDMAAGTVGTPLGFDFLSGADVSAQTWGCHIVCEQTYSCGSRTYGPFYIDFELRHGWFRTRWVTNVSAVKF